MDEMKKPKIEKTKKAGKPRLTPEEVKQRENETIEQKFNRKQQKFIKVATPKLKRIVFGLQSINKCIKSSSYAMTQEQVTNIQAILTKEIEYMLPNFENRNKKIKKEDIEIKF